MKIISKRQFEECIQFPNTPQVTGFSFSTQLIGECDIFVMYNEDETKYVVDLYYSGWTEVYHCSSPPFCERTLLISFQSSRVLDREKYFDFKDEVIKKTNENIIQKNI